MIGDNLRAFLSEAEASYTILDLNIHGFVAQRQ